jgi:hypothetical protein
VRPPAPPAGSSSPAILRVDPTSTSEVDQLARWKASLDAGTLTPAEFAASKTRLLGSPGGGRGGTAADSVRQLAMLDSLRDLGALTGPEYLQFRRRVLVGA